MSLTQSPWGAIILKEATRQGLPFLLLCCGLYYLYTLSLETKIEQRELRSEIQDCNNLLIQYYQTDHIKMVDALYKNSSALQSQQLMISKLIKK